MKIKVLSVEHHRNGVHGNSFYVVLFKHGHTTKVGIVFDDPGNVAVLDVGLLAQNNIEFGENSWRGDEFESELRKAVESYIETL